LFYSGYFAAENKKERQSCKNKIINTIYKTQQGGFRGQKFQKFSTDSNIKGNSGMNLAQKSAIPFIFQKTFFFGPFWRFQAFLSMNLLISRNSAYEGF
jgi:hypothetical protein